MAIDTALKRASALSFRPRHRPLGIPDGTVDAADRAMVKGLYAGLTYVSIAASAFINIAQKIARAIVQRIAFDPVSTRKDQQ